MEAILGTEEEPDLRTDDVMFRSVRDARAGTLQDPQPKFGIPVGPVVSGAGSDYLHAVPADRYRSTFHPMRNPDLVKDDLAFRFLRKDEQLATDPAQLGIVRDPHGVIVPQRVWRPPCSRAASRSSPPGFSSYISPLVVGSSSGVFGAIASESKQAAIQSLASGMARVIRKQSAKPSAQLNDLISYRDLKDTVGYDCMRYSLDTVLLRRAESVGQLLASSERPATKKLPASSASGAVSKRGRHNRRPRPQSTPTLGRTVYEILRNGGGSGASSSEESSEGGDPEEVGSIIANGGDARTMGMEEEEEEEKKKEGEVAGGDACLWEEQESGGDCHQDSDGGRVGLQQQQLRHQLPQVVTDSFTAAASCRGGVDDDPRHSSSITKDDADLGPGQLLLLAAAVGNNSREGEESQAGEWTPLYLSPPPHPPAPFFTLQLSFIHCKKNLCGMF